MADFHLRITSGNILKIMVNTAVTAAKVKALFRI